MSRLSRGLRRPWTASRSCSSDAKPAAEGTLNYAFAIAGVGTLFFIAYAANSAFTLVGEIFKFQRFHPLTDPRHYGFLEKKNK